MRPMLLIDELCDIKKVHSAKLLNVKKDSFFVQGHFPDQPVTGVLIVSLLAKLLPHSRWFR